MNNIFIKLLLITSDLIGLDDFELLIELLKLFNSINIFKYYIPYKISIIFISLNFIL